MLYVSAVGSLLLLTSIPLYRYKAICLPVPQLMHVWVHSSVCLLQIKVYAHFQESVCVDMFSFLLPGNLLVDHMLGLCLSL